MAAVLSRVLPRWLLDVVLLLYEDTSIDILYFRRICSRFRMTSRIKQGCPMSGSIFALAIDPVLRVLSHELSPFQGLVCAYADDIGLASSESLESLPLAFVICDAFAFVSALWLNFRKVVIVLLDGEIESFKTQLIDVYSPRSNLPICGRGQIPGHF